MSQERRKHKRIEKHFILFYSEKEFPEREYESTQLKNISEGGMCFVTSRKFEPGVKIVIQLKTPYLAEATHLEGRVLESHEKVRDMIYETRIKFESIDRQGEFILSKLSEFFIDGEDHHHA